MVGILWVDDNYQGSSFTLTAPAPCTDSLSDVDYGVSSPNAGVAMNDRTSSVQFS